MFGKIKNINDSTAVVYIDKNNGIIPNLMNLYVVFESDSSKILGEVIEVQDELAYIDLKGEFVDNKFIAGTLKKPSLTSQIRGVTNSELEVVMGSNNEKSIYIGKSPVYQGKNIFVDINDLFSNHLAIFGNSGSGKSCSVSRIIQNVFLNKNFLTYNANIFMFDAYGEYKTALNMIDQINPNYQYKFLTTNPTDSNDVLLRIPIFLLSEDDMALLLNADNHTQVTIITRMIKLAKIFSKHDENSIKLKNHLIAKAIMSVLFSNKTASLKKNDILTILSNCSTNEFNLNVELQGVGYTRIFSECFKIDRNGEFGESVLLNDYVRKYINDELEENIDTPTNAFYNLRDLSGALDFTLIGEGFLDNQTIQDYATILQVRLNSLLNGEEAKFFDYNEYIDIDNYVSSLIVQNNKRSQIVNINLENISDALAKNIVKIMSRILFDFSRDLKERASIPFHLFIEEAHRYVVADNDNFLLGYNIFERIAKEGRKYGVILDLISQRPVEISETVISQMNNFLILKVTHPKDLEYIEKMLPNISSDIIAKLNSLQSGTLVAFGNAFKIPLLIKIDLPNPLPYSANCDVLNRWRQ